ncbi:DUF4865 family protein [Streptomyces hoynatensis]|uniref:DUF4865 family protein n=1 Tax=Streptomyces hoynatensis TaxID=1141874 RepID=A0A3A9YKU7_9ACTN|nr:DUF4865 family protein [Streptomyces hoynatensis]RKN37185.1 DUF4865 family protein [Streptomyces hoynatensis]
MYAKQYEITLPADYDMGIIRRRVADFGALLDDRAGLGWKAYLIRERGVLGSTVNQYAPFYLWRDTGAMGRFLLGGGGFQGIVRDFGRPAVHHWTPVATLTGPARAAEPRHASRRLTAVPEGRDLSGEDLAALVEGEIAGLRELAARPGVHSAALAVDPRHWQLVRLVLWAGAAEDEEATERYEVLHLSAPEAARLPEGRHW